MTSGRLRADLLAWDLALMEGKVLSKESYAAMIAPRRLSDGGSSGYGCGLRVRQMGSTIVLTHNGALSGFVALNSFVPSTRSAVVLLANEDFATTGDVAEAILAGLLPYAESPFPVDGPPATEVALDLLDQLRQGEVNRETLAEDFSGYLTPERLAAAADSLHALGETSGIELVGLRERGEMEVATTAAEPSLAYFVSSRWMPSMLRSKCSL